MSFLVESFKFYANKYSEDPVQRQKEFAKRMEKNSTTRAQERVYTNMDFKPQTMFGDHKVHPMYEHWTQLLGHRPNKRRSQ